MIHTAIFEIEFITPCFCAGADPEKPELRVPSIVGQLRWWYRVMNNGAGLESESDLFGAAAGKGKGRSPILVRICDIKSNETGSVQDRDISENLSNYLWYFLKKQGRKCLRQGTSFSLVLSAKDESKLKRAMQTAALWACLGSLGARGTRAAGAMRLKKISLKSDSHELQNESKNLDQIKGNINDLIHDLVVKHTEVLEIRRLNNQYNLDEGLNAAEILANQWKTLRKHTVGEGLGAINIGEPDHNDVADYVKENQEDLKVRRAILGLPFNQSVPRGSAQADLNGKQLSWFFCAAREENKPGEQIRRFNSPFHLRPVVHAWTNKKGKSSEKIFPCILIFKSKTNQINENKFRLQAQIKSNNGEVEDLFDSPMDIDYESAYKTIRLAFKDKDFPKHFAKSAPLIDALQ